MVRAFREEHRGSILDLNLSDYEFQIVLSFYCWRPDHQTEMSSGKCEANRESSIVGTDELEN